VNKDNDFTKLWIGQTVSAFGDSLTNIALIVLINATLGGAAAIATLTVLIALPQIVIGLLSGVIVDRYNRKTIILLSEVMRALCVLGLIGAAASGRIQWVYALAFAQSAIGTFFGPARSAYMRTMISDDADLQRANGAMQTSATLASVLGSGLGGVLAGSLGLYWLAFVLDALTFLISFGCVALLKTSGAVHTMGAPTVAKLLGELRIGLRLVFRTPFVLATMIVASVMMLGLGAINVLFVPYLTDILKVPATWFGAVEFAQVLGMILGGSLSATLLVKIAPQRIVALGAVLLGAWVAAIGVAQAPWHLLLGLFAVGLTLAPLQASASTAMQTSVPVETLGRASAAMNTMIGVASVLSMIAAGALSGLAGIRAVFWIGGAIAAAAGVLAMWLYSRQPAEPAATLDCCP
jgi:MFS family permease